MNSMNSTRKMNTTLMGKRRTAKNSCQPLRKYRSALQEIGQIYFIVQEIVTGMLSGYNFLIDEVSGQNSQEARPIYNYTRLLTDLQFEEEMPPISVQDC